MAVKMTMDTKTVVKEETKEERDKRLGADEKKARELLAKNVKFLMDQKGWNQQELADKIGCGAARITGIMKEEWSPSIFPILHELKRLFGYSIDELLFTDIGRKWLQIHMNEKLPIIATMNFVHLFQGYYFDTSASLCSIRYSYSSKSKLCLTINFSIIEKRFLSTLLSVPYYRYVCNHNTYFFLLTKNRLRYFNSAYFTICFI